MREKTKNDWRVDRYTLQRGNFEASLTRAWSSPTKMFWIWTIASHNGEGPWLAHDSADTLEKAQEAVKTWLKEHPDG